MPLNDIISGLQAGPAMDWVRLMQSQSDMEKQQAAMAELVAGLQQHAAGLSGQFQQEAAAPLPQSPMAEFAARLSGGIADVLNPRGNAGATAEDIIKQAKSQAIDRRKQRLQFLEKSYMDEAERAARIGDTLAAQKAALAAEKHAKAYQQVLDMEHLKVGNDLAEQRAVSGDARQLAASKELATLQGGLARQLEATRAANESALEDKRQAGAYERALLQAENARLKAGWTWDEASGQAVPPPAGSFAPDKDVLAHVTALQRLALTLKDKNQRKEAASQLAQAVTQPMKSEMRSPAKYALRIASTPSPAPSGGILGIGEKRGLPLLSSEDVVRSVLTQYPELPLGNQMEAVQSALKLSNYDVVKLYNSLGLVSDEALAKVKAPETRGTPTGRSGTRN